MKLGRIYGMNINLNNGFLALLGLFFIAGVLDKGLIAFGIVLLHELAHITAARYFKVGVSDVELLPFGGVSHIGGEMVFDPAKEIYVAIVGPATNFLLFGLGTALRNNGLWCNDINAFFLQANLMVAAFNLLPALPLDGGRVYRACLAKRIGFKEATYQAAWWGQFWGVLIVLGGVVGLVAGMSGLDIVITGAFLLYAAINEKALASYHFIRHLAQKKLELATVGVLPGETLVSLDTVRLGDILRLFVPKRFHLVLLVDKDYRYCGMVSEAQMLDAMLKEGLDIPIGRIAGQ